MDKDLNVFGDTLKKCGCNPMTGYYRNGKCSTDPTDKGLHTVCVEMTKEFLSYSKSQGNDLSTPKSEWGFPGLVPGDKWCLCALRWQEAYEAGKAPLVYLEATHKKTLTVLKLTDLKKHAVQAKILSMMEFEKKQKSPPLLPH